MTFAISGTTLLQNGHPVRMRGVSLGNWMLVEHFMIGLPGQESQMRSEMAAILGPQRASRFWRLYEDSYYTEADIAWFAGLGFNLLRLPFNHRHFSRGHEERGFALIDRIMTWAANHDMVVLLDMHAAPGCQADDWNDDCIDGQARLWTDRRCQDEACRIWQALAQRYHQHPALFGYDPICEPVWHDPAVINDVYRRCCAAIRSVDPTGLITLEGNLWSRDAASLAIDLFDDPQVIVHSHVYPQHSHAIERLERYPDPDLPATRDSLWEALAPTLDQERIPRPALLGEFGISSTLLARQAAQDLMADFVDLLESQGIHWSWWAGKDLRQMGLLHPDPSSAWTRFLDRPSVKRARAAVNDICAVDFQHPDGGGMLQQRMRSAFPEEDPDLLTRRCREALRQTEVLALRAVLRELSTLDDATLDACATAFAHGGCVRDQWACDLLAGKFIAPSQ